MTRRIVDAVKGAVPGTLRSVPSGAISRYRLDVLSPNVIDAVRSAGGWVSDMAMAGWDVRILVVDRDDDRPLRILGAQTLELESQLSSTDQFPEVMAVAVGLLVGHARVHDHVLTALRLRGTKVTTWGEAWLESVKSVAPVEHRLSNAARAYKAAALGAAGVSRTSCESTETFFGEPGLSPQLLKRLSASAGELVVTQNRPRSSEPQPSGG